MLRSKIALLPKRIRDELDRRLLNNSFSDYRGLVHWLASEGFVISASAVYRHGTMLEMRTQAIMLATDEATAIAKASPDTAGAMNDVLIRLVQERVFHLLLETENVSERDLPRLARAIADLARSTVAQKKWAEDVRERLENQKHEADGQIREVARQHGLSPEAAQQIRHILLGINPLDARVGD